MELIKNKFKLKKVIIKLPRDSFHFCNICKKYFCNDDVLQKHIKSVHDEGLKKYQSLEMNIKNFQGVKKYQSHIGDKAFNTSQILKSHDRQKPEKKYQ